MKDDPRGLVDTTHGAEGVPTPHPAALDIEQPDGTTMRRALEEAHVSIGRSTGLSIVLDHHTVSRRHAEIVRDPFGRHWVRDLASTNGTTVNGERVTERVLAPGDRIGVGDVGLHFRRFSAGGSGRPRRSMQMDAALGAMDESPTSANASWVRSFRDIEPPKLGASHLSDLLAFGRELMEIESASDRLERLCRLLVDGSFQGLAAVAVRVRPEDLDVTLLAGPARGPQEQDPGAPYLSRRLLRHVATTGEPALASSLSTSDGGSMDVTMIGTPFAAIGCPLAPIRPGQPVDLIYASFPILVAGAEWVALVELAADAYRQAESAWLARQAAQMHVGIERELATARRIQHAIVPKGAQFDGLEVELGFEPCRWVGGDYVDAVTIPDGRVLLAVADVCGKGLQAALVTFSLHTMVRALAGSCGRGLALSELVERVGEHIGNYLPEDSFATMACVAIDPRSGALESVNAGHLPGLIVDREGRARTLPAGLDPPLGMGNVTMTTSLDRLGPGELLFMYTDGLTELRNTSREMLGEAQLTAGLGGVLARAPDQPLRRVAEALELLLDAYRGDQLPEDDRAYVLARRR